MYKTLDFFDPLTPQVAIRETYFTTSIDNLFFILLVKNIYRKAGDELVVHDILAGQTISRHAELCGIGVGAKGQQGSGDGADLLPGQSSEVYM